MVAEAVVAGARIHRPAEAAAAAVAHVRRPEAAIHIAHLRTEIQAVRQTAALTGHRQALLATAPGAPLLRVWQLHHRGYIARVSGQLKIVWV